MPCRSEPTPPDGETITILRSLEGPLTKRIGRAGDAWTLQGYSAGAWFSVHERTVAGLPGMADLLATASAYPHVAIVRGQPLPGADRRRWPCRAAAAWGRAAPCP